MAVIRDTNDDPIFDDLAASGTLGSLNSEVNLLLTGQASAVFHVVSIGSQTIAFEGSVDGSNYFPLPGTRPDGVCEADTIYGGLAYRFNTAGLKRVRARCSAYTSGSASVVAKAGQGSFAGGQPVGQDPVNQNVTASGETAISGVPAPGSGLANWIRKLCLVNNDTSVVKVSVLDGSGGTVRFAGTLAANGGVAYADFGAQGWLMTENTQLYVSLSGASDVDVNVTDWRIAT